MAPFDASYTEYQVRRSLLRRCVRRIYLRHALPALVGPTLDFGCGIGDLLAMLPHGSKGLEYNRVTVEYCRSRGLDVEWYDGEADGWNMSLIDEAQSYESLVISHVLEHLDSPIDVLRSLLVASMRFGIERVLVVVPSRAGYSIDPTHRTFVNAAMLREVAETPGVPFRVASERYFPGNVRMLGDWLIPHELQVLYKRESVPHVTATEAL